MSFLIGLKFVSLILSLVYGICIIGRIHYKVVVDSEHLFMFAISFATFIFLQFNLF